MVIGSETFLERGVLVEIRSKSPKIPSVRARVVLDLGAGSILVNTTDDPAKAQRVHRRRAFVIAEEATPEVMVDLDTEPEPTPAKLAPAPEPAYQSHRASYPSAQATGVDDFEWRDARCKRSVVQIHHQKQIARPCVGRHQFRKKGTAAWICFLCAQWVDEMEIAS